MWVSIIGSFALIVGACGRDSTAPGTAVYGAAEPPVTSAAPSTSAATTTAPVPPPPTTTPVRSNRTVVDAAPLRIYLTVGTDGRLTFDRDERIPLTVRAANISTEAVEYDTNERRNFEIRDASGAVVWQNTSCKAGRSDHHPALTGIVALEPKESVSFADAYPLDAAPSDVLPRGDCRLAPGVYDVFGVVAWCPPGTATNGTCYPDVTFARSLPVRITLTDA